MEDDILPHELTVLALESLNYIKEPWDIVNFSNDSGIKNALWARKYFFGEDNKYYFQRQGMRNDTLDAICNRCQLILLAHCYVVTRHAGEVLLKLGYPVRLNADYLLGLMGYHRLRTFMAFLSDLILAGLSNSSKESTIGDRPRHRLVRV